MPVAKEELSDDYVASLLAKDAKASNAKYSTYGLQELLPKRAINNAPKPNTRFLKTILKETDNHNTALRAKESLESRARFRNLRERSGGSSGPRIGDGGITPEDHRSKRRRVETENEEDFEKVPRYVGKRMDDHRTKDRRSHRPHPRRHRDERYSSDEDKNEERTRHPHRRHHHHKARHRRSESRSEELRERRSRHQRQPRSSHRCRSHSPRRDTARHSHRQRLRPKRRSTSSISSDTGTQGRSNPRTKQEISPPPLKNESSNSKERSPSPDADSDPLEAIIGPPPPPPAPKIKSRGRGAFASSSAMDSHFSSHYDPTTDVQPDLDGADDWDMALEALRDRQRWQKQGAERLKSAGFTEEEVLKWEKGADKGEDDVVWNGRGEGREWDKGKVLRDDGVITESSWGRLKGT